MKSNSPTRSENGDKPMDEDQELAKANTENETKDQEMTDAKNENSENDAEEKEKSGEPQSPSDSQNEDN